MEYILLGFSQSENVRQFFFERTGPGNAREKFTVTADLAVVRRYKIATQELPLLCRRLLDGLAGEVSRSLVFSEAEMRVYAGVRATELEERALKKKPFRKHVAVGREGAAETERTAPSPPHFETLRLPGRFTS